MPFSGWDFKFLSQTSPQFFAMWQSLRSAVISRCYYVFFFHDNGSHLSSQTCRSLGCEFCHLHEIFIPTRSIHGILSKSHPSHFSIMINLNNPPFVWRDTRKYQNLFTAHGKFPSSKDLAAAPYDLLKFCLCCRWLAVYPPASSCPNRLLPLFPQYS